MKDFMCILDNELVKIEARSKEQIKKVLMYKYDYKYIHIIPEEDIPKLQVINNKLIEVGNNNTFEIYKLKKITYRIYKDGEEKLLKVTYDFETKKGDFQTYKYLCFDKKGHSQETAFKWLHERVNQKIFYNIRCTEDAYKASNIFAIPKEIVVRTNNIGFFEVTDEIFKKEI